MKPAAKRRRKRAPDRTCDRRKRRGSASLEPTGKRRGSALLTHVVKEAV
ncbi:MAG: hypothetical protein NC400_01075 [Clostridium sp.]|nr:hypothetical protein [Clostridium sp.]